MTPIHEQPDDIPDYQRYYKEEDIIMPDLHPEEETYWHATKDLYDTISETLANLADSMLDIIELNNIGTNTRGSKNDKTSLDYFYRNLVNTYSRAFFELIDEEAKILKILETGDFNTI